MLFHSYEFLFLFLPITLIIFYIFVAYGLARAAVWWVGLASLFFYAYWDMRFLWLFCGSILFNFLTGQWISRSENNAQQRLWLLMGLIVNLGLLFYFKYINFFLASFSTATGYHISLPEIILPIGISFFTFTQIAYLVDCLKSKTSYSFRNYLLFVSFFPHLIAGPILRHNDTIYQFESKRFGRPSAHKIYIATLFFSVGLFKKVIIADNLAYYVDPLFRSESQLNLFDAWAAAILYTFQIYFDFSAYSEMAVGLALLMNVRIPLNFNSPYKSLSIIEFWRRWHISLSTFLRDYLYIPLGGNRKGTGRRYINLFITMLLGGLWHGAAWTFVIWGGLHGIYLAINHAWIKTTITLPRTLAWLLTFFAVVLAWIFFRAQSVTYALELLESMFQLNRIDTGTHIISDQFTMFFIMISLIIFALFAPSTQQMVMSRPPKIRATMACAMMLLIGLLGLGKTDTFIYFQF